MIDVEAHLTALWIMQNAIVRIDVVIVKGDLMATIRTTYDAHFNDVFPLQLFFLD